MSQVVWNRSSSATTASASRSLGGATGSKIALAERTRANAATSRPKNEEPLDMWTKLDTDSKITPVDAVGF